MMVIESDFLSETRNFISEDRNWNPEGGKGKSEEGNLYPENINQLYTLYLTP